MLQEHINIAVSIMSLTAYRKNLESLLETNTIEQIIEAPGSDKGFLSTSIEMTSDKRMEIINEIHKVQNRIKELIQAEKFFNMNEQMRLDHIRMQTLNNSINE